MLETLGKTTPEPGLRKKVWFKDDVPGDVYQQGMDRFVIWGSEDDFEESIELCDLYLEQSNQAEQKLIVEEVRFSSETFPWVVDAEFLDVPFVCCRIVMVKHDPGSGEKEFLCASNWFFVIQTLTLRHLERAYGAFCRMNNMEMDGVSSVMLEQAGIQSRPVSVRGCLGLRRPFPFEEAEEDLIKCSGGLLLTGISHTVQASGNASDDRYRLRSHKALLVEGLCLLKGRSCWYQSQMVSEGLDGFLYAHETLENIGATFATSAVESAFNIFMFSYQLVWFLSFPALAVVFLQVLDSFRIEAAASHLLHTSELAAHAEDIGQLPRGATLLCVSHVLLSLLCIIAANALPSMPGAIPHLADRVLSLLSICSAVLSLLLLFIMLLFFLIGALLSPAAALKPLVIIGACLAVVVNMWMQFSSLTRGLLQVVEIQVDSVFTILLDNMVGRLKDYSQASAYDQTDLDFAFEKADNRFRGLNAEGKVIKQMPGSRQETQDLFKSVQEDAEFIQQVQEDMAPITGRGRDNGDQGEVDVSTQRANQLTKLYQHYLGKTSLEEGLEWRIFEETDALTDIMLREHNMRLQLLDFGGIASADKEPTQQAQQAAKVNGVNGPKSKPLPKAYLIHKSIFRDSFDHMAEMIVQWVDPLLQWDSIVEKVTNFFDDAVPKFICSCAMSSFDVNRMNSVAQKVLAKVAHHVEETIKKEPAKTMKLSDLMDALRDKDGWASGLLFSDGADVLDRKQALSFVQDQVKHVLPNNKTTNAIPVYKLVPIFEGLLEGRVWWSAMIPFLKEECGFASAEIDLGDLAEGFKTTSKGCGFMDFQDIPDVLMWMTDGGLWKAAAVALLREIGVGGELGNERLGKAEDEAARVDDEWACPKWPDWILERWQEATDEKPNPGPGEACFLQKSDVPGLIEDLLLQMDKDHLRNESDVQDLEALSGCPDWKYKPMDQVQGCPAEMWVYVDDTHLAKLRGVPWEAFDFLLEQFDMDMPEPASRKIFSSADASAVREGFIQPPEVLKIIEHIQTTYRPISLSGFHKLLSKAGITLPKQIVDSLFGQQEDITLKIGDSDFPCQDLVDLDRLGPDVEKYLSGGMWLEAVYGVLQNEEVEASFIEVSRHFAAIDKQDYGVLKPRGVIQLMMSLQRTGISYETFAEMISKDMRFTVTDSQLRILFNMIDKSGNGSLSKIEFMEGFEELLRQLVPRMILKSLMVLPEQVASHILNTVVFLLLLFAFVFTSMEALAPASENMDFMGAVQAGVAGMAALGVQARSTSGMDAQSIKEAVSVRINELLPGVAQTSLPN